MICETVRQGTDCPLMTVKGCSYNGGLCHEVVEQCEGCGRQVDHGGKKYCAACPEPARKWKNGNCNLATHVKTAVAEKVQKINPLKASKRGNK